MFLLSIINLSQLLVLPDDKFWSVPVPRSPNACGSDFLVFLSIKFSILKIIEPPMAEKSLKIRDAVIESAQNFFPSSESSYIMSVLIISTIHVVEI